MYTEDFSANKNVKIQYTMYWAYSPVNIRKYPPQIPTSFISQPNVSEKPIESQKKSPRNSEWWNTLKYAEIQDGRQIIGNPSPIAWILPVEGF